MEDYINYDIKIIMTLEFDIREFVEVFKKHRHIFFRFGEKRIFTNNYLTID